jgi:hypothetical protein
MNPLTGRFWTSDVFAGFHERPATLHKYLYCEADGVNRIDPSGHLSFVELMIRTGIDKLLRAANATKAIHRVRKTFAHYCSRIAQTMRSSIKEYQELIKRTRGSKNASHHVFQDAAMETAFATYSREIGLAMPVLGKYGQKLTPHWIMNQVQAKKGGRGGGTNKIPDVAWYSLRAAGCRNRDATTIVEYVETAFEAFGIVF